MEGQEEVAEGEGEEGNQEEVDEEALLAEDGKEEGGEGEEAMEAENGDGEEAAEGEGEGEEAKEGEEESEEKKEEEVPEEPLEPDSDKIIREVEVPDKVDMRKGKQVLILQETSISFDIQYISMLEILGQHFLSIVQQFTKILSAFGGAGCFVVIV